MKNKKIDELFEKRNFDKEEPAAGHKSRFFKKLEAQDKSLGSGGHIRNLWAPLLSIAAVLAVAFMVFGGYFSGDQNSGELSGVSPQMEKTEQFYTQMIKTELANLKAEKSPNTEKIVIDALSQLEKLETEYKKLQRDLQDSGKDKRVIYAMISNFQQRINLLKEVLNQIEHTKTLKDEKYL